jgi:hypothetical protein
MAAVRLGKAGFDALRYRRNVYKRTSFGPWSATAIAAVNVPIQPLHSHRTFPAMEYYELTLLSLVTYSRTSMQAIPMALDDSAPALWDDDLMAFAALQLSPSAAPSLPSSETFAAPEVFAAFLLGASPSPAPLQYNFIEPVEDDADVPPGFEYEVPDPPIAPPSTSDLAVVKRRYGFPKSLFWTDPFRRRKMGNVKIEGQRFGRGGVPRCALCRKHRQRVITFSAHNGLTNAVCLR